MNGISIIIPNTNFGDSPLGKVNFVLTPQEKAQIVTNKFSTALGTTQYSAEIYNMVHSLCEQDLYDKIIVFYPMVGTSLRQMSINLIDPEINPLKLRENAAVSGMKLSFSNTIEVSAEDTPNNILQPLLNYDNHGFFFKAKRNSGGLNSSELLDVPRLYTWNQSGRKFVFEEATRVTLSSDPNTDTAYAMVRQYYDLGLHLKVSLNGGSIENNTIANTNKSDAWWHGSLGVKVGYTPTGTAGTTIAASSSLWDGTVSYLMITDDVSDQEIAKISTILAAFCSVMGK